MERNPVELDNYGLGKDAIQVDLSIQGDQNESLLIGGANPTGEYYMMPLSGPHKGSVLTVAKASVDFLHLNWVIPSGTLRTNLICNQ